MEPHGKTMEENDGGLMSSVANCSEDGKSPFGLPEKESECYRKLILVLLKMLNSSFKTSDDTVFPKLLDFIQFQGKHSKSDHEVLMRILCEWLKKVCQNWSDVQEDTKVFALKVSGYVASSPQGFMRFSSTGSLTALLSHIKDTESKNSNALELGYLCLLEALLSNPEGSRLVIQSGLWKNVVNMALCSSNIYCTRQSTKLLGTVLRLADDPTAEVILQDVTRVRPSEAVLVAQMETKGPKLGLKEGNTLKPMTPEETKMVNAMNVCRMLILHLMDSGHPVTKIKRLTDACSLSSWSWSLLNNSMNKSVLDASNKLTCMINSLLFYQNKDENGLIPHNSADIIVDTILNHVSVLNSRLLMYHTLDACADYQIYLHKFGATVAGEEGCDAIGKVNEDIPFLIHTILFLCQAFPVLMCLKARKQTCLLDVFEEYIDKLFRITNHKVMRYAYSQRDTIVNLGEDLCVLGVSVMQRFHDLNSFIKKEQGLLIFQASIHLLEEFVAKPEESKDVRVLRTFLFEGDEFIAKHPTLLLATLNCIHCYLAKFDFKWWESLESLCLLSFLQRLLISPAINPRITVEALRLIDLVLQKFVPPNLALLVDTIKNSSIEDLGPELFRLLHSVEWVVRDSTLEVIKTISTLSESSFPAFQRLLTENKLPEVVFSIIATDHEPFVRSSAVSCLHELARVTSVWQATLSDKNVTEKLLLLIHHESEGIVRVAAAKTITALYSNQRLSPQELDVVYDTMSHSAQHDLHWEVRTASLEFWRNVMYQTIRDQGMTDGVFPDFVFSKDEKKIVKLTPSEIGFRIMRTLHRLGNIGCLQVLYDTFHNEADLEVQTLSAELMKMIQDTPKRYELPLTSTHPIVQSFWRTTYGEDYPQRYQHFLDGTFEETQTENPMEIPIESDKEKKTNDVIEQIVSEGDKELLGGLVTTGESKKTLPQIKRIIMTDLEFTCKMSGVNIEDVLAQRSEWVKETSDGFISLLDDVLLFANNLDQHSSDRNAIDCY